MILTFVRFRTRLAAVSLAAVATALGGCSPDEQGGRRLVVGLRSEPSTLNPTTVTRTVDSTVIGQLHGCLVATDRDTLEPVPELAESWQVSDDGRVVDLELRRGVRFSDGEAFDAEDVVFTFETLLNPEIPALRRSSFVVGGEPAKVTATGPYAVRLELGAARAAAVRSLDGIAILPSHKVRPLVQAGEWAGAWGVATPPAEMAGLGPFRLARYQPGERLVVERNPYYWKRDTEGRVLPYLDEIEFEFIPAEAEVVRFAAGSIDVIDNLSPESFIALEREEGQRIMTDVGPGLRYDLLVFNLNELEEGGSQELASRQAWFRERLFRQAVSMAVDRESIAHVVYRDHAIPLATHQSPAVPTWAHPDLMPQRRDPRAARRKLREAGFAYRGASLVDSAGREVRFSILVSASSTPRRKIASLLQQDLESLGMRIDVIPLEHGAVLQRVLVGHDYDAAVLQLAPQDTDPMAHVGTLVTGGGGHVWRMGDTPVTEWERELDRAMQEQATTVDTPTRQKLYWRALEIVATELPFIPLVSPNVLVGTRVGLAGTRPSVIPPHLLWNSEQLHWESGTR